MAINLDLEMKRQIGFDMLIIVVDFRHEFNKGNMETERWNISVSYTHLDVYKRQECEFDNRFATPEEQEILSQYVGWGGIPEAFDENNPSCCLLYTSFQNFYLFCCKPPDGSLLHLIQNLLFTNFAALLE